MPKSLHAAASAPDDELGRLPFFQGASPAALAHAASAAAWLSIEANQLVFDYGDDSTDVFFVVQGALRVLVRTALGQEMILGDLSRGELFGDVAAVDNAKRSASVMTLLRTRLCRLPAGTFLDVALHDPTLALRLLRTLTARLRREDERLFELTALPVRERLGAELLRLSKPRGRDGRIITPPPPQHVIAARIGARRESVSLSLRSLAEEKLIEVSPRAIRVPRPEALRAAIDKRLQGASASQLRS
jgi:CRP/FNR family cyclic AMP-dependent transcriptional regulator